MPGRYRITSDEDFDESEDSEATDNIGMEADGAEIDNVENAARIAWKTLSKLNRESRKRRKEWPERGDCAVDARKYADVNARRLFDLRLCCYYAFCVWMVTFIVVAGYQGYGRGDAAQCVCSEISCPASWHEFTAVVGCVWDQWFGGNESQSFAESFRNAFQYVCNSGWKVVCSWWDTENGPVRKAVTEVICPVLPSPFVALFTWLLALLASLWTIVLIGTLIVFAFVLFVGMVKVLLAPLMRERKESDGIQTNERLWLVRWFCNGLGIPLRAVRPTSLQNVLRKEPKVQGPWMVLALSGVIAVVAAALQPLLLEAALIAAPKAVKESLNGVLGCRCLVAFFAATLFAIYRVSSICRRRIREWGVFGWKTWLGDDIVGPTESYWERLGSLVRSKSWQGLFLERIALPVGAITILLAVVLLFVSSAIATPSRDSGASSVPATTEIGQRLQSEDREEQDGIILKT
ncbi:MAG: hypothetical protein ACYTGL_10355 [Planctomycetota bacterium]